MTMNFLNQVHRLETLHCTSNVIQYDVAVPMIPIVPFDADASKQ